MYNTTPPAIDWAALWPMIIVAGTGILTLIIEMLLPKRTNGLIVGTSLIGLLSAGFVLTGQLGLTTSETFAGMIFRDRVGIVLQMLLIVVAFLTILFSEGYLREKRIPFGEFYHLALWATAGGMIMVSTKNLLMLFLGLEVLSIAFYVMAGMSRQEAKSEESALKYFLLGAFATGFLLYGIAMTYGATGGLHLDLIPRAWSDTVIGQRNLLIFGVGLILMGLSFKVAFVPFHQWTPDVYQGAPSNVTAFMAAGVKIAAIGALFRVLEATLPLKAMWFPAMFWIAILTMTVANLVACLQRDVKRTLAYSSIAHAGYLLVGILAHVQDPQRIGLGTVVFYLLSYSLMTIGAFAVVSLTAKDGKEGTKFADLAGLWQRAPGAAAAFVIFVVSLIGVPPTAGFFGKLLIFQDALRAGLTPLAIVLAINSAISAYYYIGMILAAFVAAPDGQTQKTRSDFGLASACIICATGTVAMVFFISPLMSWLGFN